MKTLCALLLALIVVPLSAVLADDPTPANLKGSWSRESEGIKLKFTFTEKVAEVLLERDGGKLIIDCDFAIGRDRSVFFRVQEVKSEGGQNTDMVKGDTFSFQFDVSGDKAVMMELKTKSADSDIGRKVRMIVEGDYTHSQI